MAQTVQAAFIQFLDEINLSGDHRTLANDRRDHLIELLGNKFHVIESFPSGSIPKYTALHEQADLDIILVLHYGKHVEGKTPAQVLKAVRDSISYKTTVRRNGQAVTLFYGSWPCVDIVPVCYVHYGNDIPVYYHVPDMNTGTWLDSTPKTHAKAIQDKASECGENFRKVIKFLKHWNKTHGDFLQSYHIEVMALRIFEGRMSDLAWDTLRFFDGAVPLLQSALWHEWGYVDSYLADADRSNVIKLFEEARDLARNAWYHTFNGNHYHTTAIGMWRQIFGNKFPAYG